MNPKRGWLTREDWEKFCGLFEVVEGTNWYDTRELALSVLSLINPELASKAREEKENITTILQVIDLGLQHFIRHMKES